MPAPLTTLRVPLGFPFWAGARGLTAAPGGLTAPPPPRGLTVASGPIVASGGPTARRTEVGGLTARPFAASSSRGSSTSTAPYALNFDCAPRGAHNSTRTMHDPNVHDSASASRCSGIPALLMLPLGYAGATGTASTSRVTAGECHTGGTSGQPTSDDHAGEAGLPTTHRQTHTVGHLIAALSGAHHGLRYPR
jgi:hypothetical protein